jgi:hypothetical protein
VDRHPEHRRIVLVAPDLDGNELAQEGAEGFEILTSDRAQVLDTARKVKSFEIASRTSAVTLLGTPFFRRDPGRFPPRGMFQKPCYFFPGGLPRHVSLLVLRAIEQLRDSKARPATTGRASISIARIQMAFLPISSAM